VGGEKREEGWTKKLQSPLYPRSSPSLSSFALGPLPCQKKIRQKKLVAEFWVPTTTGMDAPKVTDRDPISVMDMM